MRLTRQPEDVQSTTHSVMAQLWPPFTAVGTALTVFIINNRNHFGSNCS